MMVEWSDCMHIHPRSRQLVCVRWILCTPLLVLPGKTQPKAAGDHGHRQWLPQECYLSLTPLLSNPHVLMSCLLFSAFSSVQFSCSVMSDSATPWIAARHASLSITNSQSLLKLMSIESVMPSSHLILCRFLLLLPPIPPSIRVFSNESTFRMRWPEYWSFSFSISPSSEHPGLISFRMDWLDLLAVQGTLKSLLQHHFGGLQIS